MALTQSAWVDSFTINKGVGNLFTSVCTVISTTAETDAYTLKTPKGLDPSQRWTLFYKASATPDGSALPFDLWIGHSDDFVLSGQGGSLVATDGSNFMSIMDDVVLAVAPLEYSWIMDPDQAVADVVTVAAIATGLKVKVPVASYYAFNLDGGSTLAAVTHTFKIVQKTDKIGA